MLARARRVPRQLFAPDEPCGACHQAGEGLGRDTAKREVREDQDKGGGSGGGDPTLPLPGS